jgi:hypothetical protein
MGELADSEDSMLALIEFATGVASSSKSDHIRSLGHALQAARAGHLRDQLTADFRRYRKQGKIPSNINPTDETRVATAKVFDFVDSGPPSDAKYEFVRNTFFSVLSSPSEQFLKTQYMAIAIDMSEPEILLLGKCFQFLETNRYKDMPNRSSYAEWRDVVLEITGLKHSYIIDQISAIMTKKGLLNERYHSDLSGFRVGSSFGISDLGMEIAKIGFQ